MKNALIFFALVLAWSVSFSQNLIKDPGFESVYLYKKGKREHFAYKDWTFLSIIPMNTWAGAPDFSEYKSRSTADKITYSYFTPYSGNSYLSSVYAIEKNIYQGKLIQPLIKGRKYKFSCQYMFGGDIMSTKLIEQNLNYNMGVLFTKNDMSDSASIKKLNSDVELPKHISINTYNYKRDNNKWKYFESEFEAVDNYEYILIGSFQKLMDKSPFPPNVNYGIGFRFDELTLVEIR